MQNIIDFFSDFITSHDLSCGELTLVLERDKLIHVCTKLRDEDTFSFKILIDLCAVDYAAYGQDEWEGSADVSSSGFNRGCSQVKLLKQDELPFPGRYAVVYHLLSVETNQRIRLKVFLDENDAIVPSVTDVWPASNWFEREAFDMLGIIFEGHPDLRRILTDYGFIGHPLRKDFPLVGKVEARYDHEQQRVIYEPVSIDPRVLVPKVIRKDWQQVKDSKDIIAQEEGAHG